MPVLAFRFLKVDLFPTLSDQVCCTAGESLKGWFLVLGIVFFSAWLEAQWRANELSIGKRLQRHITVDGIAYIWIY